MTMLIGVLFLFGEIPAVCQNLNEFYVLEHDRKTPNEVVNRPQVKISLCNIGRKQTVYKCFPSKVPG